uniref:Uncharacterized protein n=1 Tax=Romanomermis culicivorax TaxID=13658 RepID=A0A915KQB8_ROMCU
MQIGQCNGYVHNLAAQAKALAKAQEQPGRRPKLSLLQPELAKEDNAEGIANMEETIEQVAKKFANLLDDSDRDQTMDPDTQEYVDQRAQTSSRSSSSFKKLVSHQKQAWYQSTIQD